MKYNVSRWEYSKELDCLLFFSQRVSELLFDYTSATYKFPTLYSASLCYESIKMIRLIESESMGEKSIIPIKEELRARLPKDLVVKQILGDTLDDYINVLKSDNLHDIRINLELLYNKIRPDIYLETVQMLLQKLVVENKEKSKIDLLATNFISVLIDCGFSQSFINIQTELFFFQRSDASKISTPEAIKEYFKLFVLEPQKFQIILSASSMFNNIKEVLSQFKIEIVTELPTKEEQSIKEKSYLKRKKANDILLNCSNISALDPWSAKEELEKKIKTVSKLFNFFHHKDYPLYSRYSVIYSDGKFLRIIGSKTSAMHKCQDYYPNIAGKKLNDFIHGFSIKSSSFRKIDKAIELHGESLKSDFIESQLLQNWIAFETLLVGYSKESKIDQVLNGLIPSLKLAYFATVLKNLQNDLIHWDKTKTEEFLQQIKGDLLIDKIAQLVCIEENKPVRDKFYNELELFPLLKNRILRLKNIFSSPESALAALRNHEQKTIWQIRRIYRTRNQIVHLGYVSDFTPYLVENSHNYLDIFINQIIYLVIQNMQITSLEHGLKEIKICQARHESLLKLGEGKKFTMDNYSELIFGKGTFADTRYSQ